jgi:predicted DNA-binding transcriptional regulator AlpA
MVLDWHHVSSRQTWDQGAVGGRPDRRTQLVLGVPVGTLYSWRVQRRGPARRRIGRFLRYRPEDVTAWFTSLSDWPAAG